MLKQNTDDIKLNDYKYTNNLIRENSPYLLQHAHNPVNWYPWGDEALKKARDEDKLIIISIGYSACHWCHVMAHECFENEDIAKIMNDNFVCIKVDREERPDIDNIYMTAVQLITGRGGWPLNCFALPDGKPVYGGTYFRPNDWTKILLNLSESYKLDKSKFIETANNIQAGIRKSEFSFSESVDNTFDFNKIKKATERLNSNFDTSNGGMNYSPKFLMPVFWNYLLEYGFYSNDKNIKSQVELTLNKIAQGGIYDQLAGGFARYSTDAKWIVPHFEKMLYDNAQLVSLYSKAYLFTGNKLYKNVVFETLVFVKKEMTSPENAFYSSYDADSEGEEGKYYVWKKTEINSLLKENSELFCEYYNVSNIGNWENGKNILYINEKSKTALNKYKLSEEQAAEQLKQSKKILLKERETRIKPGLDDKSLTSWNALMISAYVDAYEVFGNIEYLQRAENTTKFILEKMSAPDFSLKRSYKNGNAKINAFSDDYVFTVEAFIKLYQAVGNEKYLQKAKLLTDYLLTHFYDKKTGMFFYTSDNDTKLTVRQKEISDNVIPSSNSVAAKNLYKLGTLFTNSEYIEMSEKMLSNSAENIVSNLNYFAGWASLYLHFSKPAYELVIVGKNYKALKEKLTQKYRPDVFFAGSEGNSDIPIFAGRYKKGETLIYVCRNNVCNQPVKTVAEAEKLLSE
ncbi:MAG: thioredoxin domain-containing protein [Chlorobi bacterium]|nr:thioredoxin domain-containing protein [Chlorobiota bacterium]